MNFIEYNTGALNGIVVNKPELSFRKKNGFIANSYLYNYTHIFGVYLIKTAVIDNTGGYLNES